MTSAQQQRRTISLQIPPDAAPGDTLSFVVDGTELELMIPEGTSPGEVLEIQVGGDDAEQPAGAEEQDEEEEEGVTRVPLHNDKTLLLHHDIPPCDDQDDDKKKAADGTHAMAWTAGFELVKCLSDDSLPSGTQKIIRESQTVLELGSGLGLVGLALAVTASTNKRIVLSDCESAVPLLKRNVEQNQHLFRANITVQTQTLNWEESNDEDATKCDLIIGSDLLYNVELIPAFLSTIQRLAKSHVLLAVRWRKPTLERRFFQDSSEFLDWKLLPVDSSKCTLSWQDYGNPKNDASNAFFLQTMVAVKGTLRPLAEIDEVDTSSMTKEEYEAWERLQIQVYEGTIKATAVDERDTKRARVEGDK